MLTTKTVNEFIDEVASSSPAPGGGSVAALAAALGSALTSMVCNLTIGKKKYAGVEEDMKNLLKQSEHIRTSLTQLIDDDTEAFNGVMAALGQPKESDEQKTKRSEAIQRATKNATLIPLHVMELCGQALSLTKAVAEKGNLNSISDAGVAALMLHAACLSAKLNVQINLGSLNDSPFTQETAIRVQSICHNVEATTNDILARVNNMLSPGHA